MQELVESEQEHSIFHSLECKLVQDTAKCICNNKCINTSEDSRQADLCNLINLEKLTSFFPECLAKQGVLCLNDTSVSELPSIIQIIPPGPLLASFELESWPQSSVFIAFLYKPQFFGAHYKFFINARYYPIPYSKHK